LELSKFAEVARDYFEEPNNRRSFFEEYAKEKGFDPLSPNPWYLCTQEEFLLQKGAGVVLKHHGGSFVNALSHLFPEVPFDVLKFRALPADHWNSTQNKRNFFTDFAKRNGFSITSPKTWSSLHLKKLKSLKTSEVLQPLLQQYNGRLKKALMDIFPDFFNDFWYSASNRRKFFEDFALENRFDPLIAANWYSVKKSDILSTSGGQEVLDFYDSSFAKALVQLFPDIIGLDFYKFDYPSYLYWKDVSNRRKLFDSFARDKNFDPLNPENWYPIQRAELAAFNKRLESLLKYSMNSFPKALMEIYPDIGLDPSKLSKFPKKYWADRKNRRDFFIGYAADKGLDPSLPDTWYPISSRSLLASKRGGTIFAIYKGSFVAALMDLFPELKLERQKFTRCT